MTDAIVKRQAADRIWFSTTPGGIILCAHGILHATRHGLTIGAADYGVLRVQ